MAAARCPEWLTSLKDSNFSVADAKVLRQKWTEYLKEDPTVRHEYLYTPSAIVMRGFPHAVQFPAGEHTFPRISIKSSRFLHKDFPTQKEERNNLSTPHFYTALGGRAAGGGRRGAPLYPPPPQVSHTGRVHIQSANYHALNSRRIHLPKYLVDEVTACESSSTKADEAELCGESTSVYDSSSGVNSPVGKPAETGARCSDSVGDPRVVGRSTQTIGDKEQKVADLWLFNDTKNGPRLPYEYGPSCSPSAKGFGPKRSVHDWYNLIKRPVPKRPKFATPVHCKTPRVESVVKANYLRPTAGMFYAAGGPAPKRNYKVNPNFLSETVHVDRVAEMASNPLKFGWG